MVVADTSAVSIGFHGVVTSTLVARYVKTTDTRNGSRLDRTKAAGNSIVKTSGASDVCFYLPVGPIRHKGLLPADRVPLIQFTSAEPARAIRSTAGAGWNPVFDAQVIIRKA